MALQKHDQGRSGYVLIWASAPPNIFYFAQLKIIFCPNGKKYRPILSDFCPTKNLTAVHDKMN
jgi:hypothetical protein